MAIVEDQEVREVKTGPNGSSTTTAPRAEEPRTYRPTQPDQETMMKASAGGSLGATALGLAAFVLSILGLARVHPTYMAPIAVLILGVAVLLDGAAVGTHFASLFGRSRTDLLGLGGGVGMGVLAGVAGIVLGFLALIGVAPATLVSAGLIVLGTSLLFGSGIAARMESLAFHGGSFSDEVRDLGKEAVAATAGLKALMGLGALILGILALLDFRVLTLQLVATLMLGFAMLVAGSMSSLGSAKALVERSGRSER